MLTAGLEWGARGESLPIFAPFLLWLPEGTMPNCLGDLSLNLGCPPTCLSADWPGLNSSLWVGQNLRAQFHVRRATLFHYKGNQCLGSWTSCDTLGGARGLSLADCWNTKLHSYILPPWDSPESRPPDSRETGTALSAKVPAAKAV